jgi:cytoskeletal protein RodZ
VNPGGGSGWDERPLDIQVPDDARELDRDVLAYHRELRAKRRRNRLRRLTAPLRGQGTVMPLLASILAVCLVAGAMLSVATFSPATAPGTRNSHPPTAAASSQQPVTRRSTTSPAATRLSSSPPTRLSSSPATRLSNSAAGRSSPAGTSSARSPATALSGSANPPARQSPSAQDHSGTP